MGRVIKVVDSDHVEVLWMFAKSLKDVWIEWRDPKTNEAYRSVMLSRQILQDSHGVAAKMSFRRVAGGKKVRVKYYLDAKSLRLVQEILEQDDFSSLE